MSRLLLSFLGPPRVYFDGVTVELNRRKVLALLAYLAVTAQPHDRDALAELLYSRSGGARERANFRATLSHLIAAVGAGHLEANRNGARIVPGRGLWVDVTEYRRLLELGHAADKGGDLSAVEGHLAEASRLFRGDFLSDLYLKGCPTFEEWQLQEQQNLRKYAGLNAFAPCGDPQGTGAVRGSHRRRTAMAGIGSPRRGCPS